MNSKSSKHFSLLSIFGYVYNGTRTQSLDRYMLMHALHTYTKCPHMLSWTQIECYVPAFSHIHTADVTQTLVLPFQGQYPRVLRRRRDSLKTALLCVLSTVPYLHKSANCSSALCLPSLVFPTKVDGGQRYGMMWSAPASYCAINSYAV